MELPVVGLVVLAVVAVVALLVALRSRRPTAPDAGGAANALTSFTLSARRGYEASDVEDLMDRVYQQPASAEGRADALELLTSARFHLARGRGYEPVGVDGHVDALIAALESGQDLPTRPSPAL